MSASGVRYRAWFADKGVSTREHLLFQRHACVRADVGSAPARAEP
jgi:hypothetical protein